VRESETDDDERFRSAWGWRAIVERLLADLALVVMSVVVAALYCLTFH
jgi:hypothetical protein